MESDKERSDRIGLMQIEAASKLDYFILSVALAVCAYLAQTNPYARIGVNEQTLLLGCLLIFTISAFCGFKRIESINATMQNNAHALNADSEEEHDVYSSRGKRHSERSVRYYNARNLLLLVGLLCYIATKVWARY